MHDVAVAVDQAGVPQMQKLSRELFFKNWIKKTSFQNEYYGQTYKVFFLFVNIVFYVPL